MKAARAQEGSTYGLARRRAVGMPCGPVNNYDKVFQDPQVLVRNLLAENVHPKAGRVRMVGKPLKFSNTPATDLVPSAALGEQTEAILHSLGYAEEEITHFKEDGVV